MPQLLVRNLDPKKVAILKKRAKDHGRSLQAEVKQILETAAHEPMLTDAKVKRRLDEFRSRFAGRKDGQ